MGPFPHDAPAATISADNPMGTDGFEFVEYAHPKPEELHALFKLMGYAPVARHKTKKITVYRQGDINYLVNEEPGTHGHDFVAAHGPCAPSMAFRVVDAKQAYERALSLGAEPADVSSAQKTLDVPAIKGIGGSLLYFVDRYGAKGSAYDTEFEWLGAKDPRPAGAGLYYIDHLTHNVHRGRMDVWTGFYEKLFNFRQIRFFDIEGRASGLFSRALTSPDGKIRIPINEDAGDSGQIEEYLNIYRGEGIQHIACGARDIYRTVESAARGTACRSCRRRRRPISRRSTRACRSMARTSPACSATAFSSTARAWSTAATPRCCCRFSRRTRSGRSSSNSSSARATMDSARAISRRCSN